MALSTCATTVVGTCTTRRPRRNEAAAKETVAAIEAAGGSAFAIGVELGVPGDAEALWEEFDRHADGLDILVNNAGIGNTRSIEEIDEAEFDSVFAVNVKAPFLLVKHGMSRLREAAESAADLPPAALAGRLTDVLAPRDAREDDVAVLAVRVTGS